MLCDKTIEPLQLKGKIYHSCKTGDLVCNRMFESKKSKKAWLSNLRVNSQT